jgi:DNA invertase Pin-like site-specific DNA recombinase
MKYIAYYRVSTKEQGKSGLGIEAQKQQVIQYLQDDESSLIGEYTEYESGKNNDRQILQQALDDCKNHKATLLIAKLDRLSRNVAFIFQLRDSAVNFVCCDLPDMNTLTIGLFAVVAQYERELISKRTKDALAVKKANLKEGERLGNPEGFKPEAIQKGISTRIQTFSKSPSLKKALHVCKMHQANPSPVLIVKSLNELNILTPRGKKYNRNNVRVLLKHYEKNIIS